MPSGAPRATNGLSAAALRALLAAPDARVAALGAPLATPRPEGAGDPALGHIERLYEEQAQLSPRLKAAAAAAAGRYSGVGGTPPSMRALLLCRRRDSGKKKEDL